MTKHVLQNRSLLFLPAAFLLALPAYSITISSSISPSTLLEPDQSITYSGPSQSVTPGTAASPDVISAFGAFQSTATPTGGPTLTFTFDVNPQGMAAVPFSGTFAPGTDSISITGSGVDLVGGIDYATITVGNTTYGVQDSVTINPNKTVAISGIVYQTPIPEPSTDLICGLGLALVAGIAARRRLTRPRS